MSPRTIPLAEAQELARQFDESPPTVLPWRVTPFDTSDGEPRQWWIESPDAACECVTRVDNEDGAENDMRFIARAANTHRELVHTVIEQAAVIARLSVERVERTEQSVRQLLEAHESARLMWNALDAENAALLERVRELEAARKNDGDEER